MPLKRGFISGVLFTYFLFQAPPNAANNMKLLCPNLKDTTSVLFFFSCRRESILLVLMWAGTHSDALVNPL